MLCSLVLDAMIAAVLAFIIANVFLLVFGNIFLKREESFLRLDEIIKEIQNIISEERK